MNHKHIKEIGWIRVIQIIIPYILIVGSFQLLAYFILGLNIENNLQEKTIFQKLIIVLFTFLGTLIVIGLFRKYIDKKTFKSLGFENILRNDIYLGLLTGFFIMSFSFLMLLFFNQIYFVKFDFDFSKIIFSFLIFSLVAVTEELLIRGYILNNLMVSINKYLALAISATIFSLMHVANDDYGWFPAIELFISGIFLGISYIYTKNLVFPIVFHFSWNFFQGTVFGFNVSGNRSYSMLHQSRLHDNIWNGGAFGFEGSIFSIVAQIIMAMLIYLYWRKYRNVFQ
ncbi:CPBP family intramembrane glutamic endopeptidase [Pedobacter paludis]|uniref:CPBP family intramembrane metalloprotease n=1 Tax=Pedobacter paludis TaxID=2203212 RepID=A0A317F2T4_9SPHI|nr:CPBP family intramembrane glutamic endopeptidase [Pedobacter paludis]PWS31796.1 CPBP family intramembrane metalloprotease [Pedobacter paludis]